MARKKASGPVIVKKYGNRRLYDTGESRYVTLEELEAKVRGGTDVTVVDAKSGEDLTQATLTQIIIEGRGAGRMLPVPLLVQLIRLGDEALAEFVGRWMGAALDVYLQARQRARMVASYNPFATMPFDLSGALARMLMGQMAPGGGWGESEAGPGVPPAAAPAAGEAREEVRALREELEALKASLGGRPAPAEAPEGGPKAPRKRPSASKATGGKRAGPAAAEKARRTGKKGRGG